MLSDDELRALADALERYSLGTGKIGKAADYLRACADNPTPAVPPGWQLVPVEPTPEMLDEGCDVDARAEVIKKYAAMPVIRNPENYCSCGEMLAVQYRAMLAAAPAAPQAEPLSDEEIDKLWKDWLTLKYGAVTKNEGRIFARLVEAAHGIRSEK